MPRLPLWGLILWMTGLTGRIPCLAAGEEMSFFTRLEEIPERGLVTAYVITLGTNQFSFLPPPSWQVKGETAENKVVLISRDMSGSITLTFHATHPLAVRPLKVEPLRQEALTRYPKARVILESPCYASAVAGWAIELEQFAANEVRMTIRLAYVPVGNGLVEFQLTTPARKPEAHKIAFGNLLTSFRIETRPSQTKMR